MQMIGVYIDRVFHRVAIGRALAELHRIGIADHDAGAVGDEMRQAMLAHVAPPPLHLVGLQGFRIMCKGRLDAAHDMAAVDVEHGVHILVARGPHDHRSGLRGRRTAGAGIGHARHAGHDADRRIGHSRTT
jgi:hypothetical protein